MNECKSEIKVGMKKAKWMVSAPCVGVSLTQAVDEGQRAVWTAVSIWMYCYRNMYYLALKCPNIIVVSYNVLAV